jgi:Tfp pilus assembly protein PilE
MKFQKNRQKGFAIGKLLGIIVLICILAAIIFVAYRSKTNGDNTSRAKAAATQLQKKVRLFSAKQGYYPGDSTNSSATHAVSDLNSEAGSAITNTSLKIVSHAKLSSGNGQTSVEYKVCDKPAGATGYQIYYWDYTSGGVTKTPISGGVSKTKCTQYIDGS